jgi:hypothetical protein
MNRPARQSRLRIERHMILDRVVYSVRLGPESFVESTPPDIETLKIVRAAVDLKDADARIVSHDDNASFKAVP